MAGHGIKLNWEVLFLQMLYTQQKQVLPFLDHGEFNKGHVQKKIMTENIHTRGFGEFIKL